ncbi:PREDICTED: nesprin-1-like isoform X2 [Branchiostoma belcheri]|uniref:Nesprin-1-like isoform X2 n=1 Tax=Branchiostoma belcheri TaxID=7741 RepID=A0A6P4Y2I5_BRABE|nr:PREDICTED: nesprin-1-like isoform X2 [Branchiostoma belcheri]
MSIDVLMDRVRSGSTASEDRSSNQSLEPEERGKDSGMSSGASVTSSPMPQVRPQHPWDQARHDMLLGRRLQAYGLPGELVPGSLPSTAASVTSTQSDLTVQELDQSGAEYMSLPVEFRPETPLSTGDPELDQLNKSCRSLQEQVSSREQQLLQALQHQEEYQQAVSEVSAGLDTTQAQLDAVLVGGDDLENQLIDVQFVLAELSQLREGVKKVEERGQQAAQSAQSTDVEGNVQVTTSDLHHRLASLKDQAAAKQKEIEEKLEQQRAHQETLSAYQAEMQALHTWVTSARVQSSIDFITASDKEALDEQLEENKRLQSDLEDHLIRLPELQDRCSDLVEKEPPAQAELMFSQLNNLQRDMADLQEALTNREENISQAAEACEQREKELEEYQSRVEKMQKWIAHSKGAAVGEEGVSISVTAATPDSPSETSPEQLFGVAQGSADQDTTDTPMEMGSDHEMPADETGVAGAEGGARPTSPGSKRAPPTLPSIPEHHSALMRQKGALDEGSPTYEEKQKALDEELAQHKHLLKSIAKKGERILRQRSSTESDMGSSNGSETDMADLKQRWEELSQEIGERKQQLQLALQQNRPPPQLQRKLSMSQFRPPSFDSPGQGETNMGELKNTLDDLHKCWENMQSEMTDSQSRLEEAMDFQQKYQDALEDVSGWLDNIELKLFTSDWSKDSEAQLAQNESLRKEISAFQDQVYVMNRACQQLMVEADSRNRQVVQQTLSDLKDRLHTLEGQALQKEQELIEKNSQWKDFQMEINSLYTWITETKSDIMNDDDDTEYTIQDKLAHLQDIEDDISDHEDQVNSILERGREMGDDDPRAPVTMETTMLQSNWDELLRIVNRRKNDLGKAATALQQYEKLLQDYSDFIETAEEKLNTGMLTVTGLEELKLHLEKHSEFFLGLDAQKVLVDSLLQKLDPSTREQYIEQHTGLNHRAANALDRAQRLSQDLDTVAQTWVRFEEEFERQNEWLQETEEQVPVEDMSEDVVQKLQDRVTLYQEKLKIVVTILKDHQPVVQRMLDMGNSVLQSVYCPALETKLSQFEDRWTAAKTKTSQELSKLEQLYNQWRTFDKDSTKLIDWLEGAVDKLNKFAEQEPRGIDKAIDDFTEFRKEADLHQPLKESSTALGHQLILLKSQQAETVQERLKIIETNWTQLMGKIPAIEKQLHRTQMEMLPSRQALAELLLWMDRLEAALQDTHEEDMAAVVELQAVLQKYKGYKIDMSAKQLTVDFINQSVMQSSQGPEDGDFLVKHEAMNTRWEELNNLLQARMDRTEALLSHAKEFEGRLNEVKSWLQEQEAQLKRHQKRSSEVEVQHALAFCQDLDRELKEKNTEVAELVKTAQQQVQGKDNPAAAAIQQDMEAVRQGWTNLQQQVSELQLSLSTLADQWKQYYQVQQTITQHLGSTEYTLGRFKPGFGDLETLKKKAEELKELQEEFMAKEDNLVVHGELAAQLMQESDPVVKDRLQREVDQLKARDTECLKAMENQLIAYDQIVELWQQYQDQYSTAKDWVIVRERTFQDLLKTEQKENRSLREEYEELLSELEQYGSDLVGLGSLCEQLCAHVENPASAHLNSQCKALIQRLDSLKQQVIKKLEVAKTKAADSQRFEGEVESLQKLLQEAEEVLQSDDPNKSADETTVRDRMDQIKTQMLKFNNYSGQLEDLNSLGYRLALGEEEANKLRDLNQRWYNMSTLMSNKYRTMQGIMLDKQNFAQKCETWMLFLAQTEKDLAVDIAGNYEGLLEQQKAYEIFQADLFSRQQILHSIVSDGQRIMAEEVLEDPEEDLQQRLTLLRDQWQNVLRRSNERKQVIDHRIQQWQLYKSLRTKVLPWMVEMKHEIVQYEFTSLSLERVRAMLEDVEASLKKVTAQEPTYNSLVETAVELMQVSDKQVEGALERELTDIQKEWNDISGSLEHKRHQLESLLQSWSDCEDDIEGCLAWLRDIKRLLTQDVPSNHDELQREMHICKEYETAFQMTENKLTNIHGKEQQLAGSISPEDLSLLQERVRFLRKQWDEIHLQTTLRRQKVTDKLNEWSSFSDRYKELSDWLTEMEVKITHNPEVSIEDLLENLQKEYQEEMSNADDRRRVLADMGQQLLKAGNEARATEIEYKLAKMQDRWQHLTDLKCARIKKLKETLTAVQQLENNMNSLRSWLSEIEQVLSHPVVYESCDATEIQRKLQEQQELQKDIEKHSTGVASVLNLCEVLLHDCDACATDAECESIQLATRTLDRRWRNICALSMERRLRIEETWRLWQKFQEDYQRFEHWLQESERTAAYPNSGHVTYTVMKEEVKKYEAFQRKIHEGLTQLELLNKQYRRLARESRTDTSNKLKGMVHDANHRWDTLSKRVNCILRRLKHALGLREEFETTRESLLVWLTEMDLQLTNMEHFSDCDVAAKIKQMKAFQQEIDLLSSKLEYLDTLGLHLMQKCEGEDAVVIQDELDDFHRFCGEVFNRVYKYHTRLTKLKAEYPDIEMEEIEASGGLETYKLESGIPSERLTPHSGPGTPRANRSSGRGTPASVESLDWDMYGLEKMPSGSADNSLPASHAVENGLHESVREGEARHKHMEQQLLNLSRLLESAHDKLGSTEAMVNCDITMGPDVQDTYHDYVKLLSACQSCIENIRHIQDYLTENPHLSRGATSDQQLAGVLDRWDSMKQAAMQKQTKLKQACQQWNQFQSDLNNIMLWLNEAEALLREQDQVAGDIHSLEIQIKKHREFLAALDLRKAIVMSINLCSPQFVQGDSEHAQKLRDRLTLMNHRWEAVCNHAVEWQRALQVALVQCAEVQNTVADLFAWLDEVERRRNRIDPIELDASQATLRKQYRALLRLKQELQDNQPRVAGLKSTADQLLETADSQGSLEIKSNLHIIDNRLRLLLEVISADLKQIEGLVDVSAVSLTPEKTVTFKLERSADSSPASSPDVDDDEDRHGFYGAAAAAGILAEMDNTYNEDEDDDRHGFYGAAAAAGMIAETDSGLFGVVTGEGQVELEGADARMLARPGRTSTPISSDKDSSSEVVEDVLDSDSSGEEDGAYLCVEEEEGVERRPGFLRRVFRKAVPLQILMLLLVGTACLVPLCEEDYNCVVARWGMSLHPVLRYVNGPPPM